MRSAASAASSTRTRSTIPRTSPAPRSRRPTWSPGPSSTCWPTADMRELTEEELARAVHLDPSQIAGLGPSLEALMEMLRERKRKILETYETDARAGGGRPAVPASWPRRCSRPPSLAERFRQAVQEEQLYDLERLWYRAGDERGRFARQLVQLIDRLGDKYQVDELAAKYEFTGRTPMTIPQGPGDQGGAGRDRPAAEAAGRGGQDGADRRDRPGGPGRVRRAGRHGEAQRAGPADRGVPPRPGRAAGPGKDRPGLPAHAQGLPALPGPAAGADLQQPGGLADRPAPGAGRRRRGGRAAADQALRVRRLAGQHGHPRLADQRHDPRRAGPAHADAAGRHRRSTAPATRPSAPPWCCWT